MVEYMIELVEGQAALMPGSQVPSFRVGLVEIPTKSAEKLGHGQISLAVPVVERRIDEKRLISRAAYDVAAP